MRFIKSFIGYLVAVLVVGGLMWSLVRFYPFIFSKHVVGKIERVERVEINVALMQNVGDSSATDRLSPELYSFAVAIKTDTGEIFTSSAQDRQWAVAQPGQCVEAKFYPYPFWNLDKSGTYFNARMLSLKECN